MNIAYNINNMEPMPSTPEPEEPQKKCGNCLLCLHTDLGDECQLTDNPVDYGQDGCIDYIAED